MDAETVDNPVIDSHAPEPEVLHSTEPGPLQRYLDAHPEEKAEFRRQRDAVLAALPAEPPPCDWLEDDEGHWDTACGNKFTFNSDPPHNWFMFCCYCGTPARLLAYPLPEGTDDGR